MLLASEVEAGGFPANTATGTVVRGDVPGAANDGEGENPVDAVRSRLWFDGDAGFVPASTAAPSSAAVDGAASPPCCGEGKCVWDSNELALCQVTTVGNTSDGKLYGPGPWY